MTRPTVLGEGQRRVIIVAPHFPPSNLAGVHRSRLFARHLSAFGWEPVIISVDPARYEEKTDPDLSALVQPELQVERVGALPARPVRVVGDVGIRAFAPMLLRILRVIDEQGADFLYIPIPSFYSALLGPLVRRLRGVPFGIDYIDPWLQAPAGNENLKGRVSRALARLLEPIAVRHASLITGVAASYYEPVLARNPHLRRQAITAAMPYGGEADDHAAVRKLGLQPTLFPPERSRFRLVYAGALLPRAAEPLERICAALAANPDRAASVEFHFIGSGKSPDDPAGFNVRPVAERHGLWKTVIHEYPARIPFLQVLAHLEAADGVFVLGSTEAHYTPSKLYQAVLAGKPVFAVLHESSTACRVLSASGAGIALEFAGESDLESVEHRFLGALDRFITFSRDFQPVVDHPAMRPYSARAVTGVLAAALDDALRAAGERSR